MDSEAASTPTTSTVADEAAEDALRVLVERTLASHSRSGADFLDVFEHPDMALAGSGIDEYFVGPERVREAGRMVADFGFTWTAREMQFWRRGEVAWAQIPVKVQRDSSVVHYRVTGIFVFEDGRWQWVYWGGCEPQRETRV